ncbi:MAG: AAA domain-containing protein [Bacteroidota bacterium]
MREVLKSYLKRLANLSGNNRSLLLRRLTADQFLDLHDLNVIHPDGAFGIISYLVGAKSTVLCDFLDSRHEETNVISRRLKRLQRMDNFLREERGSKDLYVGWPFVKGKFSDGTSIRCPLLFFPVSIELKKEKWIMTPRKHEGITFNKAFFLAYAHYNQVSLTDEFLDRGFEDFDDDMTVFRTSLYQLLKESPVELNFNQENFQDNINPFKQYKKDEFEKEHALGELKMFPEAVLGIFPQSGSQLVPDYTTLMESSNFSDLEEFFAERVVKDRAEIEGLRRFSFLDSVEEEKMITPFKMDAHQENAIKAIKQGNSVVVQGPPGTGKSQLICNLIADSVALGKKVLVVCQKRAALDVVYNRLKEVDLHDFVSLVHDFRNDRSEIYQKIARQISRIEEYQMTNNGLDSIQLERKFLQTSRRIDQLTTELEEFKFALFDESECGISAKELYLTSNPDDPAVSLKQDHSQFHFENIEAFNQKLRSYTVYSIVQRKPNYPWKERRSFTNLTASDERSIIDIIDDIPAYKKEIGDLLEKEIGSRLSIEDCEYFLSRRDFIIEMLGILKNEQAYRLFQHMVGNPDDDTSVLWLSNTERVLMECYKGVGPELSLPSENLGVFQETLQRNMDARRSLFKFIHWRLFSKDKYLIKRVLAANNLKRNKEGFSIMVEKIDNRLNLEHNVSKLREQAWISEIPEQYEKVHFQNWFYVLKLSVKAKLIFSSLRNFKEFFSVQKLSFEDFRDKLERIYELIKGIPERKAKWLIYLTESQISRGLENPENLQSLQTTLKKDFDSLCEFDKLRDSMAPHELNALERIMTELGDDATPESVELLFENSIRLAWIEHIEAKYPILRSVSSNKFLTEVAELQRFVRDKMQVSNEMLILRARERTYQNLEFNRLNNRVTYRELQHQVTKKKRVWPLRKLISEFDEEIYDLMPCWMASPESVSAIFPMKKTFDLVIFDEASQCFVERGIPAMYRGNQLLIAGDNKQLRPNDLYRVRYEDEASDSTRELEVESLLELAEQYLMTVQLKGHYRSQSLDLIQFSNTHFYDGNLKMLPDYEVVNRHEPAIDYVKLDGIWDDNVNASEAQYIQKLVFDRITAGKPDSMGIVTFNARQQQLIMDLLEEESLRSGVSLPESLFVKNIENVQGDERDVIIFSVGYAPDKKGKMIMQFGSLNQTYGENRLNVAITRARQKIIIVSSITPQQLNVDDLKNDGPKLFRKYLEFAWEASKGNFSPLPLTGAKHHLKWFLKTQLLDWAQADLTGFTVEEELPFADITLKDDKRYLGLLLTDDDLYFQSPSIKDIHVYTPFTLSKKNWNFTGVFSREFWKNSQTVKESITRFINHHSTKVDS